MYKNVQNCLLHNIIDLFNLGNQIHFWNKRAAIVPFEYQDTRSLQAIVHVHWVGYIKVLIDYGTAWELAV